MNAGVLGDVAGKLASLLFLSLSACSRPRRQLSRVSHMRITFDISYPVCQWFRMICREFLASVVLVSK